MYSSETGALRLPMSVNRGTKRTYHEVNEESSLPNGDGEEFIHYSSSSTLSMSSMSSTTSHIQLVADPAVFFNVRSNSHINSASANREITLGKSHHTTVQRYEDLKRLRVFYKVFEVVNKLSISLGDENAVSDNDLLRKREMVSKLLKSFSEAHLASR